MSKDKSPNPHSLSQILSNIKALQRQIEMEMNEEIKKRAEYEHLSSNGGVSLPHTPARLMKPKPGAVDQRWYIAYSPWSVDKGKKVQRKLYHINSIKNLRDREAAALKYIHEINVRLLTGGCEDSERDKRKEKQDRMMIYGTLSVKDAFDEVMKHKVKLRKRSIDTYRYARDLFIEYCTRQQIATDLITSITPRIINDYFNYLVEVKGLAANTHNGQINFLRTLFNNIVDMGLITENPTTSVKRMRGGLGKNTAYNKKQVKQIISYLESHHPNMLLFVLLMYYTLMRTNEISLIQVKHINLDDKRIYLPRENSKNGNERHIIVHPHIVERLREAIADQPPQYFLFGRNFLPDIRPIEAKKVGQIYTEKALRPLGLSGKGYTLYSWKHTGVVMAKHAGMTDAAIMLQAGWRDIKSYQVYLKSLGVIENTDYLDRMPGII